MYPSDFGYGFQKNNNTFLGFFGIYSYLKKRLFKIEMC